MPFDELYLISSERVSSFEKEKAIIGSEHFLKAIQESPQLENTSKSQLLSQNAPFFL